MQSIRKRTFEILEVAKKDDRLSVIMDILLISLISLNVLSLILETLPSMKHEYTGFFDGFEMISVIIFSVEYIARVWCSVENAGRNFSHPVWGRIRYMLTPMALIDLIVIMPLYLGLFFTVDLRFMRVLRLLRVFKLTRYSASMSLLLQVLADELKSIGAALFVLCMLIIIASSLIYFAEHAVQPDKFSSIPAAMWWAIVTMTSVGYGDVVPVTVLGKVLASIISIISIGIVALPAGLLASGFSEAIRQRRESYEKLLEDVLEDGVITSAEQQVLKDKQEMLGLKPEDVEVLLDNNLHKQKEKEIDRNLGAEIIDNEVNSDLASHCPQCGKII